MVKPFTLFQSLPHSAISVGMKILILFLTYFLCQCCIFLHSAKLMHKTVISATGYLEQPAHDEYRILCLVAIDDCAFCSRPTSFLWTAKNPAAIFLDYMLILEAKVSAASRWIFTPGASFPSLIEAPICTCNFSYS